MGVSIDNWSIKTEIIKVVDSSETCNHNSIHFPSINHINVPIALIGISCLLVTVSKVETGELEDGELPP